MRTISFYQARDELNRAFLRGESDMPGPTRAIFRYLLECTLFSGEAYGWVRHDACGVSVIAKITGFSEHAVKNYLRSLEANGLIRRVTRSNGHGHGRANSEIHVEWRYLYVGSEGQGSPDERSPREPCNDIQGSPREPSLPYTEKIITEPGQAREADVINLSQRRKASV